MPTEDPSAAPPFAQAASEAVEMAAEVRRVRKDVCARLDRGALSLDELLRGASDDPLVGWINVLPIVESLPEVGKVRARRVLEEARLAERTAIGSLDDESRARLVDALGAAMGEGRGDAG